MMKKADGFYGTAAWKKARAQTRLNWRREGEPPCPLCNKPITGTPVVDHIQNRKEFPHLALDQANLRVVCHGCNSAKARWVDNSDTVEIGPDGFPVDGDWS